MLQTYFSFAKLNTVSYGEIIPERYQMMFSDLVLCSLYFKEVVVCIIDILVLHTTNVDSTGNSMVSY